LSGCSVPGRRRLIINSFTNQFRSAVFIHFGAETDGSSAPFNRQVHLLAWYCRWACERATSVYVMLPDRLRGEVDDLLPDLGRVVIVWYEADGACDLPVRTSRGPVWLLNGHQLPMVDLSAAKAAVRRRRVDVLVFGAAEGDASPRYAESVMVDETGEVVRCVRHYSDSPDFTDLWSGEASFLVASNDSTSAIVKHILARGWGLDSIGAMTRRFEVRWAATDCVLSLFAAPTAANPCAADEHGIDRACANLDGPRSDATIDPVSPKPARRNGRAKSPARSYIIGDETSREGGRSNRAAEGRQVTSANGRRDVTSWMPMPEANGAPKPGRAYLIAKRAMDIALSALGLIVLSPLLLAIAIIVKLISPGPILFAHKRQGLGGKVFSCWKFRTMCADADALQAALREKNEVDGPQFKITDDPRLTRIGRILRDYNLDELPQLLNVLVGQMSLVGPRPSPDCENQFCPAWRRARLSVKPGITGLWQVLRLRDQEGSDFQEWIYYDIEYARHQSPWLDLQIMLYTPASMFASRYVRGFVERLRKHGICVHSAWLMKDEAAAVESAA